jgi:thiamine biosynthesis lipoprotein
MGTNVHLVVVDGDPELLETAKARIEDLEQRWSRFLPDSELCQLNRSAGRDTTVDLSAITFDLITDAIDAWRDTDGLFDPTILPALVAAGYDRSFDEGHGPTAAHRPTNTQGQARTVDDIRVDDATHTIVLPDDMALDLGGIGKGRAADLVIEELIDKNAAAGACVNLGGDLRVFGAAPDNAPAWAVAIEQPVDPDDVLRVIGLADGALATSSTTKRRWQGDDGEIRHHLIDPRTHEPARTTVQSVSAIAGSAMHAEIHAKASLIAGEPTDTALPMLFVHADGRQQMFNGFEAYVW